MTNSLNPEIPSHIFSHKAMATVFQIVIAGEEEAYAAQAAHQAFLLIDQLEDELSRYRPNSDISQIKSLRMGQGIRVSFHTFQCLKQCREIYELTGGSFDITTGRLYDALKDGKSRPHDLEKAREKTGMELLVLDEQEMAVGVLASAIQVDLGGFGKGYALDCIVELFAEWDIANFMIHGGHSSVWASGSGPKEDNWLMTLRHPDNQDNVIRQLYLNNKAVSGSGVDKGQHIIDPHDYQPVLQRKGAWAITGNCALSDALSTAFMIMPLPEVEKLCKRRQDLSAIVIDEAVREYGFSDNG